MHSSVGELGHQVLLAELRFASEMAETTELDWLLDQLGAPPSVLDNTHFAASVASGMLMRNELTVEQNEHVLGKPFLSLLGTLSGADQLLRVSLNTPTGHEHWFVLPSGGRCVIGSLSGPASMRWMAFSGDFSEFLIAVLGSLSDGDAAEVHLAGKDSLPETVAITFEEGRGRIEAALGGGELQQLLIEHDVVV